MSDDQTPPSPPPLEPPLEPREQTLLERMTGAPPYAVMNIVTYGEFALYRLLWAPVAIAPWLTVCPICHATVIEDWGVRRNHIAWHAALDGIPSVDEGVPG